MATKEPRSPRRYLRPSGILALLLVSGMTGAWGQSPRFGVYQRTITELPEPGGVVINARGHALFTCASSHEVRAHDLGSGRLVGARGEPGSGPGQLLGPSGIALAPDGSIFISDTGNRRVQRWSGDGDPISSFTGEGSPHGTLLEPRGIAVHEGRVHVVDAGQHRVQIFTLDGESVGVLGDGGPGPLQLVRPHDLAITPSGDVFLTDALRNRVLRFAADGSPGSSWGGWGPHPGLLQTPLGILHREGTLMVTEAGNHRIQAFDEEGNHLNQWGSHVIRPHEDRGLLHYPNALAVSPDGAHLVVCEAWEDRAQVFGRPAPGRTAGEVPELFGIQTDLHYGERCDISGDAFVVTEPDSHSVLLYDIAGDPVLITRCGGFGRSLGKLQHPLGVAVDRDGSRVRVVDSGNLRIQELRVTRSGKRELSLLITDVVRSLSLPGLDLAGVDGRALRRDEQGGLLLLDGRGRRVISLDARFAVSGVWSGEDHLLDPTDLALDPERDRIYVVDRHAFGVRIFDRSGRFLGALGSRGRGVGEFLDPFGVAVGSEGQIYVTDARLDRVTVFDREGGVTASWGSRGLRSGEFFKPRGVAVAADGRVFVVDHGHHRVQFFSPEGTFLGVFGPRLFVEPARPR